MDVLKMIFENSGLQEKALGYLTNMMAEKNIDVCVIRVNTDGDIDLEMYKKGEVVITPAEQTVSTGGELVPANKPEKVVLKARKKSPKSNGKTNTKSKRK